MLYKSAYEQLQTVTNEIELIKTSLQKAYYHKKQKDFEACLWMLRNTLEAICKNLYVNEISTEVTGLELRQLIKKLEEGEKIPRNILPHVRTIQTFGNYGSHTENLGNKGLNDEMINPAITCMEIVYNWFINEYHRFSNETPDLELKSLMSFYKFYEHDKKAHHEYWFTDKYVSRETIIIVLGSHTSFEIFDRVPAELLRKHIDDAGDYNKRRRAIIVTDAWYQKDASLHNKFVISFGPSKMSWATNHILLRNKGYELKPISTAVCKVINSDDNILFITNAPGGTLEATQKFIESEEGLKKLLSIAWKQ